MNYQQALIDMCYKVKDVLIAQKLGGTGRAAKPGKKQEALGPTGNHKHDWGLGED